MSEFSPVEESAVTMTWSQGRCSENYILKNEVRKDIS